MTAKLVSCTMLDTLQRFGGATMPSPPRSRAELAAWLKQESAARPKIDAIFRRWLSRRRWPENCPPLHATLCTMRLQFVLNWAVVPTTSEWELNLGELSLEHLLLDCWPVFLDHWEQEAQLQIDAYERGAREQPGSFSA